MLLKSKLLLHDKKHQIRSVTQSCPTLRPHESQHARPSCTSPTPRVHWDSRPSSQWCHPAISSSVVPFSSCSQSLQASESFPMSQLFAWGGQSTGVSALASFLPKKSQGHITCQTISSFSKIAIWISNGILYLNIFMYHWHWAQLTDLRTTEWNFKLD